MSGPGSLEAGTGPTCLLIPSSASHARQWRAVLDSGAPYRFVAVNMRGNGGAPAWTGPGRMTLDDAAAHIVEMVPAGETISLMGHSMGASVAMAAAAALQGRVDRLVLVEPNAFFLLKQAGSSAGLTEALALKRQLDMAVQTGDWTEATAFFCSYWLGPGAWEAMPPDRQAKMIAALPPLGAESDAVFAEARDLRAWRRLLPRNTVVVEAPQTVEAVREIVALMRVGCPDWRFVDLPEGGHMAPVTHPGSATPALVAALG